MTGSGVQSVVLPITTGLRAASSLSVVIFLAASCAQQNPAPAADLRSSDLTIYQTVLDSMFVASEGGGLRQLALRDSTRVLDGQDLARTLNNEFFGYPVDTPAVRDLLTRSREARSLKEVTRLPLRIPVRLVDRQTLSALPQLDLEGYWSEFYKKYPGSNGLIELSTIGYDPNGDLAILMVDRGCGSLCGHGYIVALRRVAGVWRIASIQQTWIS